MPSTAPSAARSDRELTWFGEAFLKDALPGSASLEEAFRKAAALIARREDAEHETHSNPQLYIGPLMQAQARGAAGRQAGAPTATPHGAALSTMHAACLGAITARRSAPAARGAAAAAGEPARGAAMNTRSASALLSVVILAAGEGKRMKSALPKVLQPLAGRPLLKHVIDTARALAPAAIHVVYGHGGDAVRAALAGEPVLAGRCSAERLGTGHALLQAMPQIPGQPPGAGAVRRRAAHQPRDARAAARRLPGRGSWRC